LFALPELGDCNVKQIAMLPAFAPMLTNPASVKAVVSSGRTTCLRRILYLAALTAARLNPDATVFYQRLITAGKPTKVALIAVARKLVTLANTLISQTVLGNSMRQNTLDNQHRCFALRATADKSSYGGQVGPPW